MRTRQRPTLRILTAAITLCAVFGTASCQANNPSASSTPSTSEAANAQTSPIEVVASTNQWGSVAEQIGGTHVKVESILTSTTVEPHGFEMRTKDADALSKAQVIVSNGAGYDSWATKGLTKNTVSISAAQMVGAVEGDNPHLWFSSDARNAVAKELADTYSRIMPKQKKYFANKLKAWNRREATIEKDMKQFSDMHGTVSYAATEPVAYYLLSDMGFTDKTPEDYAQATADGSQPSSEALQDFQELVERRKIDVLVNNTQEAGDATNVLTGTAHKSDVGVIDITEQMPNDCKSLTSWIMRLIETLDEILTAQATDESAEDADRSSSDSGSRTDASTTDDADNSGQTDPGR